VIYLLIFIVGLLAVVFLVTIGLPGAPHYMAWKLSGIWTNQSDTLQIMIHEQDTFLLGHIVSAQVSQNHDQLVVGKMVFDNVKLKSAWKWSEGKYMDPFSRKQFDFKIKLKDSKTLFVCFLENNQIVKSEQWKLIDSF